MKTLLFFILLSSISSARDISVMSIDTGIDGRNTEFAPYLDNDDMLKYPKNYVDYSSHGTFISSLILKNVCKRVKLYSCVYMDGYSNNSQVWDNLFTCLKRAKNEHMDFVNFSSSGENPLLYEFVLLKDLLSVNNIVMVTAAGNQNKNLGNPCYGGFPGCYGLNNLVMVGNLSENRKKQLHSNYGALNMQWEVGEHIKGSLPNNKTGYMTGTSMSAAIYMNELIKRRCGEIK